MGNLHLRFDEGRVGRSLGCHPLVYSTGSEKTPARERIIWNLLKVNC